MFGFLMSWFSKSEKEVLIELSSNVKGLSQREAASRLKKFGPNKIEEVKRWDALRILFEQFSSFLVLILIFSAVLSAFLGHWVDFWVISAIVVINSSIGFAQQYKAERAIEDLKKALVLKVKVWRDGKLREVDSSELVPGDVVELNHGDKIAGDARILESEDLQANEAALTGESLPVDKKAGILDEETELGERSNMLYAGTITVRGTCKALVVSTGKETEFGKIASSLQKIKSEKTPFQKKLDRFSRQIGSFVIFAALLIFLVGAWIGQDLLQTFLTSVALAVSAIPEGLPAIVAMTLALATRRMLKVNTLVRTLPSVETLGSVTAICVDKTGTLTVEKMEVTHIYASGRLMETKNRKEMEGNKEAIKTLEIGVLCNRSRFEKDKKGIEIIGDPTENALIISALKFNINKVEITHKMPKIKEFPFSSERKMMSIVRKDGNGKGAVSYVKGAPMIILENCSYEMNRGRVIALTNKRRSEITDEIKNMENKALRVLAFSYKKVGDRINQKTAEKDLVFVGLQGMIDPPRPEVKGAISKCKSAGIKVYMITGDSPITAREIGKEIGLKAKVITSHELEGFSDKKLQDILEEEIIFARVDPHHKLRIVEALKKNREIVAVTGDGVNDVLALKRADIGIAMGIRGTDVARDVSDIILVDDNFASVVKAVGEGRTVYRNTKNFTKFLLSVNFSEIGLVLYSMVAGLPLPLLPLQILWINLITDSSPALALGLEKKDGGLMLGKTNDNEKGILQGIIPFVFYGGILAFISGIIIYHWELGLGSSIEKVRTMVMSTSILFQLLFAFTCRSDKSLIKIGPLSNRWLGYAFLISLLLLLTVIYSPLSVAFDLVALNSTDWAKVIALSLSGILVFEAAKIIKTFKSNLRE